jgi:hypothetical protein
MKSGLSMGQGKKRDDRVCPTISSQRAQGVCFLGCFIPAMPCRTMLGEPAALSLMQIFSDQLGCGIYPPTCENPSGLDAAMLPTPPR